LKLKFYFYNVFLRKTSKEADMLNLFGTAQDMVIQPIAENGRNFFLAIDDQGLYLTTQNYIGKKVADPNRYSSVRKDMQRRLKALELNVEDLVAANKHRIPKITEADIKKVNPLKASKRAMKKA